MNYISVDRTDPKSVNGYIALQQLGVVDRKEQVRLEVLYNSEPSSCCMSIAATLRFEQNQRIGWITNRYGNGKI